MYRVQRTVLLLIALSGAALGLTNCNTDRQVWNGYDECAASSFIAMAECGKQKVLTACTNRTAVTFHGSPIPVIDKGCPAGTLAFVQFTDALALAVKNREMSEAEATRRFAEYKTQVISGVQRDRAIAGAAASSRGVTCMNLGNGIVSCN
jgi:hypothetical protein